MDAIKINLHTPVSSKKSLNIEDMFESEGELLIKLNGTECYNIHSGTTLTFLRDIHLNGKGILPLSVDVDVLYEDENHYIHTKPILPNKIPLYKGLGKIKKVTTTQSTEFKTYHYIKTTEPHYIFPQDLSIGSQELFFKSIDGEVLGVYSGMNISIPYKYGDEAVTSASCITEISKDETCGKRHKTYRTYLYEFSPNNFSVDTIMISGFSESIINKMAYIEPKFNPFYFYYINYDKDGNPNELDKYGNPIKHCCLYTDPWWKIYKNKNNEKKGALYINSGNENTMLTYNAYYWNSNIFLSSQVNESTLASEDNFSKNFTKEIEDALIPDIIDMERVKYSPVVFEEKKENVVYYKWVSSDDKEYPEIYTNMWVTPETYLDGNEIDVYILHENSFIKIEKYKFYFNIDSKDSYSIFRENITQKDNFLNGGDNMVSYYVYSPTDEVYDKSFSIATSITFDLHFRKRKEISTDEDVEKIERSKNTHSTSGNVYTDGWFIDPENEPTIWWNDMGYSGETFDAKEFKNFIDNSGTTSDLIGYLNITDNDVYYKKMKLSKSFLRFSFYTSTDPITQKLLFYSTTFLDTGVLYGKFLKQKLYMESSGFFKDRKNKNVNLNTAVVLNNDNTISARVDTKIVISNEYDRTKSSEGFNIYLFAEDRNFKREKGGKTIYMKVEFNHAGNGKIIPMIMWPKNKKTGEYISLTTENFLENLYIPIKLTYIDDRYVYYIPDAYSNNDGNIELVLFEPKIDYIEELPKETT